MRFLVWLAFLVFVLSAPPTSAQSYQRYSDGLVSVQARKVADQEQRIGFEVCAQLLRKESVCPLEVRLSFWEESGRFLAQASSVLRPESSAPVCRWIALPEHAKDMSRWEISRFRCQRQGVRERPVDGNGYVIPIHRQVMGWHPAGRVASEPDGCLRPDTQRKVATTETRSSFPWALTSAHVNRPS